MVRGSGMRIRPWVLPSRPVFQAACQLRGTVTRGGLGVGVPAACCGSGWVGVVWGADSPRTLERRNLRIGRCVRSTRVSSSVKDHSHILIRLDIDREQRVPEPLLHGHRSTQLQHDSGFGEQPARSSNLDCPRDVSRPTEWLDVERERSRDTATETTKDAAALASSNHDFLQDQSSRHCFRAVSGTGASGVAEPTLLPIIRLCRELRFDASQKCRVRGDVMPPSGRTASS